MLMFLDQLVTGGYVLLGEEVVGFSEDEVDCPAPLGVDFGFSVVFLFFCSCVQYLEYMVCL